LLMGPSKYPKEPQRTPKTVKYPKEGEIPISRRKQVNICVIPEENT